MAGRARINLANGRTTLAWLLMETSLTGGGPAADSCPSISLKLVLR
jgi:uncharacterized membrane protein YidH (DUF202 family)